MWNKNLLILVIIVMIAIFLRFYNLGTVPNGLYRDETAIGYNAYSIIQTGKDEYGRYFPLYFKSFGDQKLPVYIYTATVPITIFGLNAFSVRFPSAFFGVLTVIILYFFIKNLTKNNKLALISTFLLAINPWHLHYSRATFEVSISLFFFILGGYLLNKFFQKKVRGDLIFGTVCFIIAFYSYNLTRMLAPVLFVLFLIYNKKHIKSSSKIEIATTAIIGLVLLLPFFLTLFSSGGADSAAGTLIFSSAVVQAPILELRAYMLNAPFEIPSLFFNKYLLTFWQYLINIVSYFSVDFFFIKGSQHGNHGIGNIGLFYILEFPLIIIGFLSLIKKKTSGLRLLLGWGVVTILIAALTREAPHATRSFFLLMPLIVFSAAGTLETYKFISGLNKKFMKYFIVLLVFILATVNLFYYFMSYYVRFPVLYANSWSSQDKELSLYLKEHEKDYDTVLIDTDAGLSYSSILFYLKYPPIEFQKTVTRAHDDPEGFSRVLSFGKYEYRTIDWANDTKKAKTLIISSPDKKPESIGAFKIINYPVKPVAFALKQRIISYPVTDAAYVLVEAK